MSVPDRPPEVDHRPRPLARRRAPGVQSMSVIHRTFPIELNDYLQQHWTSCGSIDFWGERWGGGDEAAVDFVKGHPEMYHLFKRSFKLVNGGHE